MMMSKRALVYINVGADIVYMGLHGVIHITYLS